MSDLLSILATPPEAWQGWGKIPWDEPEFSARMLEEHLSQVHDLASRRREWIAAGVEMIADRLSPSARVLDVCCGPGLYLNPLGERGFSGLGIDFAPAAIEYARKHAPPSVAYQLANALAADFGGGFDAGLLLYGEVDTFRPEDADALLRRMNAATKAGGFLILEVHRLEVIRAWAEQPSTWEFHGSSLFEAEPHAVLSQCHWWEEEQAVAARTVVVTSDSVREVRQCTTARSVQRWERDLSRCGWHVVEWVPGLGPGEEFATIVAQRGNSG